MPDKEVNLLDKWWKVATFVGMLAFYAIGLYFKVGYMSEEIKDMRTNFNFQI